MTRALWFVALVACSHPRPGAWTPPESLDTIEVRDDLILRGEADSAISVTARVVLDDSAAFGVIRLRASDFVAARTSAHIVVARARAWQTLSRTLTTREERAFEAARRGVASLPACPAVEELPALDTAYATGAVRQMRARLEARLRCYVTAHHREMW